VKYWVRGTPRCVSLEEFAQIPRSHGESDSERAECGPLLSVCSRPGLAAELKHDFAKVVSLRFLAKTPEGHCNDLHRSFVFLVQAPIH
jgi:hypothetical protein